MSTVIEPTRNRHTAPAAPQEYKSTTRTESRPRLLTESVEGVSRFSLLSAASRRLQRATTVEEASAALNAALVPGFCDRVVVHTAGASAPTSGGVRRLRVSRLPEGHPLRESLRSATPLMFTCQSRQLLNTLDPVGAEHGVLRDRAHVLLIPASFAGLSLVIGLVRSGSRAPYQSDDLLLAEMIATRMRRQARNRPRRFRG